MRTTAQILSLAIASFVAGSLMPCEARAQDQAVLQTRSAAKAFGLSVLVPGLGHRYVNGGSWGGAGTVFVAADVSLWLGLAATLVQEGNFIDGYTSLVAMKSGNTLEGKNRAFELAMSTYNSSEDYLDALLRARQWDRLDFAQDPDNQWEWASVEDRRRYTELRNDADEAERRKSALIGALVVNRLISGITAALSARNKRSDGTSFSAGLGMHRDADWPVANFSLRF